LCLNQLVSIAVEKGITVHQACTTQLDATSGSRTWYKSRLPAWRVESSSCQNPRDSTPKEATNLNVDIDSGRDVSERLPESKFIRSLRFGPILFFASSPAAETKAGPINALYARQLVCNKQF
jgi:hypothetical protein